MAKRRPDPAPSPLTGAIEVAARLPDGDGWLLVGWTPSAWSPTEPEERLYAELSFGTVTGEALSIFHERSDLPSGGIGFCTVLLGPTHHAAKLIGVEVPAAGLRLPAGPESLGVDVTTVAARVRRIAHASDGGRELLERLPRPAFDGVESVSALWPPVHIRLDQAVRVGESGLALAGALIDTGRSVAVIAVHGGGRRVVLDPAQWVTVRRPDLLTEFAAQYGLDDDRVGFLAYAPEVGAADATPYLEIETRAGAFGFMPFRVFERSTLGVIKQFLSMPPAPSGRLDARFDRVLGPTVAGLAAMRRTPAPSYALTFGAPPSQPTTSVLIPLYGRIDFMELQLALFSERPGAAEVIYVLDDPTLEEDAERLAQSCWARFKVPFRMLFMAENVGFAAATNAGLHVASAPFVCLLNSDVFPLAGDGLAWLDRLTSLLERDRSLGAVGPLLLFGDGTVQHQGMRYERIAAHADWWFPIHAGKGRKPVPGDALVRVPAITGACMVLRRSDLLRLGGLDEGYVIGDFEDADLCERLAAEGKSCAVDPTQKLYHLERQSQGSAEPWRVNATLYNAWRFNRRWGDRIGADAQS